MKKTSVYLTDEEAAALRAAARRTGKSQAELIRQGVRRVVAGRRKSLRSTGIAEGPGGPTPRWQAEQIYRRKTGPA